MLRRAGAVLLVLLTCAPAALAADDGRCGAGKDLVVQALERAGPQSGTAAFEDALQLLKRASAECSELGDAWYYRSLVEARLGHAQLAAFAARQARLAGSEAQSQGLQPFVLATPPAPAGRGLGSDSRSAPAGGGAAVQAGPVQQKWALVIGISQFADPTVQPLNYTTSDAKSFADLLADATVGRFAADHIHTLTDAQATTRNIKAELNWIARTAQPNDVVVIYLASHGSARQLDSVGDLNYIVTYDTQYTTAGKVDEDALYATALPMVELTSTVASRMKALRTLVVLDTCYSGGSIRSGGRMMAPGVANAAPSPANLQRMSEGSGRIVFAASRVDQESLENARLQHGYFTYYLLQELRAGKGMTPLSAVYAAVARDVSQRVDADAQAQHLANVHQNPVMDRSSEQADFALGIGPGATAGVVREGIAGVSLGR